MAVAALALTEGAAAAPAGGGFPSRVTIHFERGSPAARAPHFFGKVRSDKRACERRRKVLLFGQESGAPAERVARTRANRKGRWRIRRSPKYPTYFAEIRRKSVRGGACRADISRPLQV